MLKEFEIIIISANKEIKSWLKTINAHVALIRPDRYLYGVANNYSETTKLLNSLRDKLGPDAIHCTALPNIPLLSIIQNKTSAPINCVTTKGNKEKKMTKPLK